MRLTKQIAVIILLLLSVNSVYAQTLFGVYKSEDGQEVYTTTIGDILTLVDKGGPGYFTFSGYNDNGVFYYDQFLGTVFMTLDTKKIVINSFPKKTSVSYDFVRAESIVNGLNNSYYNSGNNFSSPNQNNNTKGHLEKVTCTYCKGSKVQESPSYGASYGLDRSSDKRCEVCGKYENHYHKNCIPCQGKGYIEKFVP